MVCACMYAAGEELESQLVEAEVAVPAATATKKRSSSKEAAAAAVAAPKETEDFWSPAVTGGWVVVGRMSHPLVHMVLVCVASHLVVGGGGRHLKMSACLHSRLLGTCCCSARGPRLCGAVRPGVTHPRPRRYRLLEVGPLALEPCRPLQGGRGSWRVAAAAGSDGGM